MIKNEIQYRITKAQTSRFRLTLASLKRRTSNTDRLHPRTAQAQIDAVSSQLADLENELSAYEVSRARTPRC